MSKTWHLRAVASAAALLAAQGALAQAGQTAQNAANFASLQQHHHLQSFSYLTLLYARRRSPESAKTANIQAPAPAASQPPPDFRARLREGGRSGCGLGTKSVLVASRMSSAFSMYAMQSNMDVIGSTFGQTASAWGS